jgi:hypothetical protein
MSYQHLILTCVLMLSAAPASSAEKAQSWKAGAAAMKITPEQSMWMAGYASRRKPSEGTAQDLFAKALVVEDEGEERVVIVTLDLISVPRALRDWLAEQLEEKYKLPAGALCVNCSHTHCGPELRATQSGFDGPDSPRDLQAKEYTAALQEKLLALVDSAIADLAPARLAYCHARAGFAMNRRTPSDKGYRNFPNPEGPVDHDVPVLRVERPDGTLRAVLFGYACHNTTLSFFQFCGDYAGYAQQYLEEAHPETVALFMLGCGGDQNPYPRGALEQAQQHGRALANGVETALLTEPQPLAGPLQVAYDLATLEYAAPPTREQVMQLAASSDEYDRAWGERLLRQLERDGKLLAEYSCPVQMIQFGDELTLVALPGETVVDYSLRLKRELSDSGSTRPAVWVAGYSNDVFAYIPSRRVLEEGGYEAGGAMRYMRSVVQPGPFAPSVEERLIGKVHELKKRLVNPPTP